MSNYNLDRFIKAQEGETGMPAYATALREIQAGRKYSHWIWYIFPQLKGLGRSYYSDYYGIEGLSEAKAYLDHPVLGSRLKEITLAVLEHKDIHADELMGSRIDARKLRSSMTLFNAVCPNDIFQEVLDTFFEGRQDKRTLK